MKNINKRIEILIDKNGYIYIKKLNNLVEQRCIYNAERHCELNCPALNIFENNNQLITEFHCVSRKINSSLDHTVNEYV